MTASIWGRVVFIVIVGLIVQVSVLDDVTVLGAHPDLMVVLAGAGGLLAGAPRGAMIGFVAGCCADLVVNTPFGLSLLVFSLVGFACGMISTAGERPTRSSEIGTCIAAAAAGTLLYAILGALVGQPGMFDQGSVSAIVVVILGAVILSLPALTSLRWALSASPGSRGALVIPGGGSAAG